MNNDKIKINSFFSAFFWGMLSFLLCGIGVYVDEVISTYYPAYPNQSLVYVLVAVILLIVFTQTKLSVKMPWKCGEFKNGMLLILIPAIYSIGYCVFATTPPTLNSVLMALGAGVVEETCYRYILVNVFLDANNYTKKSILPATVFSAAVFGGTHIMNIAAGAELGITLFQVFNAFCCGIILCAIYLRCGNIFPCMIWHFVHDVISFMNGNIVSDAGVMTSNGIDASIIYDVIASIILLIAAVYLIRPSKREAIVSIWEENRKTKA
ncbi:MAG: CPBP family intramembrane metalloprotease [Clostridia bacterium]|nr:CPBP family intramembrane metalloprotease [Clostridia bacterium]